jgi:hypothetical protein
MWGAISFGFDGTTAIAVPVRTASKRAVRHPACGRSAAAIDRGGGSRQARVDRPRPAKHSRGTERTGMTTATSCAR